jgi:hypothetical protein
MLSYGMVGGSCVNRNLSLSQLEGKLLAIIGHHCYLVVHATISHGYIALTESRTENGES